MKQDSSIVLIIMNHKQKLNLMRYCERMEFFGKRDVIVRNDGGKMEKR